MKKQRVAKWWVFAVLLMQSLCMKKASRVHTSDKAQQLPLFSPIDTGHLNIPQCFLLRSLNYSLTNYQKCLKTLYNVLVRDKISGSVPLSKSTPKVNGLYSGWDPYSIRVPWKFVETLVPSLKKLPLTTFVAKMYTHKICHKILISIFFSAFFQSHWEIRATEPSMRVPWLGK